MVEIDGGIHSESLQAEYDANRDDIIRGKGYRILRFRNEEVITRTEWVLSTILEAAGDQQ